MADTIAVFRDYWPIFLNGLAETALLTLVGAIAALAAAMALHAGNGYAPLRAVIRLYTEIILGLPILVLLYCIYFVAPSFGLNLSAFAAGILTLTLYYSPYMAEAIRAAVASVAIGQVEAAGSVGMSRFAITRRVVLPQALGMALPALVGLLIGLAKDTAILSIISVQELSYVTKQVVSRTFMPFEVWAGVALMYWICLSALELTMRSLERHLTRYRRSLS
jgi:polar amino acid transport system permease protein